MVNYKRLSRVVLAFVLAAAVATSLWFVAPLPAKALEVSFPSLPTGTLGTTHSFTIKVNITSTELVPIQSINLEIYNVADTSKKVTVSNLPLISGGSKSYDNTATGGGGTVSVTATSPSNNWAYFSGTGYAYWKGTGYSFGTTFGYGYQTGAATITYAITWTSPSGWPSGGYKAKATITATSPTRSETFIETSGSFTLSAAVGGLAGGPSGPVVMSPGVVDVSQVVSATGLFTQSVTVTSADNKAQITINKGITGKTKEGNPFSTISLTPMTTPPAPPADSSIIGLTYDFKPDEAKFTDPVTGQPASVLITIAYDPTKVPAGASPVIAYYDKFTSKWVPLKDIKVGPGDIISGKAEHLTPFTVIAYTPPAAFTVSTLRISPTEVDTGESVSISAVVTNTGSLTGSYEVTLKINNVVAGSRTVTLASGASQTVTFTTAKDAAGTYSLNVNSLSGTFSVKAAEVPAKPAAFTTSALTISPSAANVGESISISAVVTNTGGLSGSYEVTLKIDNAAVETKTVTLASGVSQTVTFTTAKDAAGTYTVNINGLSGTFSVKVVEVGPAWWVWLIVGAVVVIGGLLAYFLWWRRRGVSEDEGEGKE